MVRFICGRAGSGKTTTVVSEIAVRAAQGFGNNILLVPEQYSHSMERLLCLKAGNHISRFAEVLSFKRLCTCVFTVAGGISREILDDGGRILMMYTALRRAGSGLKALKNAAVKPEFLMSLLDMVDELKTCQVSPEELLNITSGILGEKLNDIALIAAAYDGMLTDGSIDPSDELRFAYDGIKKSGFFKGKHVWVDGYSGFTKQEYEVLSLIFAQADECVVTLCLNDDGERENGAFAKAWETLRKLSRLADSSRMEWLPSGVRFKNGALSYLDQYLFVPGAPKFENPDGIEQYTAGSMFEECEIAAARILELVRENGYRFREIAVTARNFEEYAPTLEAVFSRYGVPIYLSQKTPILEKPVIALAVGALTCINDGFRYDDVVKYLKTGLCGVRRRSLHLLENYLYTWSIRGSQWSRVSGFTQNPSGRNEEMDEEESAQLAFLNRLREKVREPLIHLRERIHENKTGLGFVTALFEYFNEIRLPRRLEARAYLMRHRGDLQLAEEYGKLWDVLVTSLESVAHTLPDEIFTVDEFLRLFKILLSQYEIGTIPVSLDRVNAGGMDRLGENEVKCQIILGACDGNLPKSTGAHGLLSDSEREVLEDLGIELTGDAERRLNDEFRLIHKAFTTPSDRLIITCPRTGMDRSEQRESFVFTRLRALFPGCDRRFSIPCQTYSVAPCFDFAAARGEDCWRASARAYFKNDADYSAKLGIAARNANIPRGPIRDKENIREMFGSEIRLSASRTDTFVSCRYEYFLKYGLRARPRRVAKLDAPEVGIFIHYVLEHTLADIRARGGHRAVSRDEVLEIAEIHVECFIQKRLGGFSDRSPRFIYLFKRLKRTVRTIVENVHEEMLHSEFAPLDFELQFADHSGDLPALHLEGENYKVKLEGFVDRVDGYEQDGILYIRVIDYKTGTRDFNINEVLNGLNMQLMLYLFTLCEYGSKRYGRKLQPAGVLYVPVKDQVLSAIGDEDIDEITAAREKSLRRRGLLLDNPELLHAMEDTLEEGARFMPVKLTKDGAFDKKSSVIDQAGLERISCHIHKILGEIGRELTDGMIEANPYYKSTSETACDYCDYRAACHFDERGGTDRKRYLFVSKLEEC